MTTGNLYEILVPTMYGDTVKPIRTRHHKKWDERVKKLTGGLTILQPGKGQWVHQGQDLDERVIPVRIMCDPATMAEVVQITLQHYRQKAVMYYLLSRECFIVDAVQAETEKQRIKNAIRMMDALESRLAARHRLPGDPD